MKGHGKFYGSIVKDTRKYLYEHMNVIEVACGAGIISSDIAASVKHLEALDNSEDMIAAAKARPHSSKVHFSVMDAEKLPYPDHSFDVAIIVKCISHNALS